MNPISILTSAAVKSWQIQVDRSTKLINELSDEHLLREIAPGRNRGIYIVGHLAAVSDAMPEILGLGEKKYPALEATFLIAADKEVENIPSVADIRQIWTAVNDRLKTAFEKMPTEAWFARHTAMTDADFDKDPSRNKLSVLLNRTNHLSYHFGQLRLLK